MNYVLVFVNFDKNHKSELNMSSLRVRHRSGSAQQSERISDTIPLGIMKTHPGILPNVASEGSILSFRPPRSSARGEKRRKLQCFPKESLAS